MAYFRESYEHVLFVVTSDDIAWCHENLNATDIHIASTGNGYSSTQDLIQDLAVLSMCNHTIMTVGTFGWWAAWLAGGQVIYVDSLANDGTILQKEIDHDFRNYYPPLWIAMDSNLDQTL